ncbi:hypothetical protein [Bacillus fungorum]|uniref:hypothetical protein n=1 Tax=Bacillus fungorum TaxID=2039284 RepID=UPI003F556A2F
MDRLIFYVIDSYGFYLEPVIIYKIEFEKEDENGDRQKNTIYKDVYGKEIEIRENWIIETMPEGMYKAKWDFESKKWIETYPLNQNAI